MTTTSREKTQIIERRRRQVEKDNDCFRRHAERESNPVLRRRMLAMADADDRRLNAPRRGRLWK